MIKDLEKIESFEPKNFVALVAKLENNSELFTVKIGDSTFPLLKLIKNKFKYLFSLPFGLYTYIETKDNVRQIVSNFANQKADSLTINFPPFTDLSSSEFIQIAEETKFKLAINTCHVVDTSRPVDEIVASFNSTRKKHIKRYQKADLLKVFITNEPFYFEQYYKLYEDSLNRWGTESGSYSKELISNLYLVPGIRMWVAENEGKVISAMICIYQKDHVFDWLAASLINDDLKKLYAPVAVQFEVIRHAAECGLKYVNMGASVNLSGVSDFKDSWGASEHETYTFYKQSTFFSISKKLVSSLNKLRK